MRFEKVAEYLAVISRNSRNYAEVSPVADSCFCYTSGRNNNFYINKRVLILSNFVSNAPILEGRVSRLHWT